MKSTASYNQDGTPRVTLSSPDYIFRQSPNMVERQRKARLRDLEIFRALLNGVDQDNVADQFNMNRGQIGVLFRKLIAMLFYRTADRTGMPALPPAKIADAVAEGSVWLKRLADNLEAMESLTSPN